MDCEANENEKAHGDDNVVSPPETFQRINTHLENNVGCRNNLSENGTTKNSLQKIQRMIGA